MPFPLHKAPSALLDLFRLKTVGRAPDAFGETVVSVSDVTDMYAADLQLTVSSSIGVGGLPRTQTATAGTTARYLGLAGAITIGAAPGASQVQLTVGVSMPNVASSFFPLFPTLVVDNPVAGQAYWVGGLLPQAIVVPAGGFLQVRATGNAAGADYNATLITYLQNPQLT